MTEIVIRARFEVAGYTAAEWSAITTVPKARELCAELDTGRLKLGNGTDVYDDLDYIVADAGTLEGHAASYFLDRAHHTGSQTASTVSDLPEAVQDLVGAMLVSGANITVTYDDTTGQSTIAVTGTLPAARMPAFTGDASTVAGATALTLATVNLSPGSFGGAGKTITATVNAKGLATAFAETAIAITASQVTDFSTAADGRIAASFVSPVFSGTPTAPTAAGSDNSTQLATTAFVQGRLTALLNGAGAAYDTLKELQDFIVADESTASALAITVAGKLAISANLSDVGNVVTARANLGLTIGINVQAYSANLTTLAGLAATTDNFIVSVGSAWASRTPAQVKTTLGLSTGDSVQFAAVTAAGFRATGARPGGTGAAVEAYMSGSRGELLSFDSTSGRIPLDLDASEFSFNIGGTQAIVVGAGYGNYANDGAAAAGGVAVKGVYRNGSVLMVRVT